MKTIATVLLIVCITFCFPATAEDFDHGEFYPLLTMVVGIEAKDDCNLVFCQDQNGNLWSFYDEDREYARGDICNLMMWDVEGTYEICEDDEIVEVYWVGYTENIDLWFHFTGWDK